MIRSLSAAAALSIATGLLFGGLSAPAKAADLFLPDPAPVPVTKGIPPGSDTVVILVSDLALGPDMADANTTARYYCSTRGKLATFVSKEHPPELRTQVFQEWSVLTYHCVAVVTSDAH